MYFNFIMIMTYTRANSARRTRYNRTLACLFYHLTLPYFAFGTLRDVRR